MVINVLEHLRLAELRAAGTGSAMASAKIASLLGTSPAPTGPQTGRVLSRTSSPVHCTNLAGSGSKRKQDEISGEVSGREPPPSRREGDRRSGDRSSWDRRQSRERDRSAPHWQDRRTSDHRGSFPNRDKGLRPPPAGAGQDRYGPKSSAQRDGWNLNPSRSAEEGRAFDAVRAHAYGTLDEDKSLSDLSRRSAVPQRLAVGALITGFPATGTDPGIFLDRAAEASGLRLSLREGFALRNCLLSMGTEGVGDLETFAMFRELAGQVVTSFPVPYRRKSNGEGLDTTAAHRILAGPPSLIIKLLPRTLWDWLHADMKPLPTLAVRCYARTEGEVDVIVQYLTRFFEAHGSPSCFILPSFVYHSSAPPEIVFALFVEDKETRDVVRRRFFSTTRLEHPGVIQLEELRFHMAPHAGIFLNLPYDPRLSAQPEDSHGLAFAPHCHPGGSRVTSILTDDFHSPHPQRLAQMIFSLPQGPEIIKKILFLRRADTGCYLLTWKANQYVKLPSLRDWDGNFRVVEDKKPDPLRPQLLLALLKPLPGWLSEALPAIVPRHSMEGRAPLHPAAAPLHPAAAPPSAPSQAAPALAPSVASLPASG